MIPYISCWTPGLFPIFCFFRGYCREQSIRAPFYTLTSRGKISRGRLLCQGQVHVTFNGYCENQSRTSKPGDLKCSGLHVFSLFFRAGIPSFEDPFQAEDVERSHFLEIKKPHEHINPSRTWLYPSHFSAQISSSRLPSDHSLELRPFIIRS